MNKYDILFKFLSAYHDLSEIHEFLFEKADFVYDQDSQFFENLECSILNLKDLIDEFMIN